jgi:N,N'-diacetyllegionaminate synthase
MKTIIIAEAGVNHNGRLNLALRLIDCAAKAKADYVKFQTYSTENLVQKKLKLAKYQRPNIKKIKSQYELLKKYELSYNDHKIIMKRCKLKKIKFLSSPFDLQSIELLKKLKLNIIKIPSGEITNIPYLKKIGCLKKKIILSTGMSTINEIKNAIKILLKNGTKKKDLTLLHCSTEYPAHKEKLNLLSIKYLRKYFNLETGYSDHSEGILASIAAVALGAKVIEKHITLNKNFEGPDHKASLSPDELINLVDGIRETEKMLGKNEKKPYKAELNNLKFIRKYIVAKNFVKKGEIFSEKNITTKRSGTGIPSENWNSIIGKKSKFNFLPDENIKK